jgi:hypothetical protein
MVRERERYNRFPEFGRYPEIEPKRPTAADIGRGAFGRFARLDGGAGGRDWAGPE